MGDLVFIGVVTVYLSGVIYAAFKCLTRKPDIKTKGSKR